MKVVTITLTEGEAAALARALERPMGRPMFASWTLRRAEAKLATALTATRPTPAAAGEPSTERRGGCA